VIHRGWAKFIEYDPDKGTPNLKFFENPNFGEQNKKPRDMEAMDNFGPIEIPSKTMFWFVLNSQGLYALTSRRNTLIKTQKFMPLAKVKSIV